jgi:hypothetical protein
MASKNRERHDIVNFRSGNGETFLFVEHSHLETFRQHAFSKIIFLNSGKLQFPNYRIYKTLIEPKRRDDDGLIARRRMWGRVALACTSNNITAMTQSTFAFLCRASQLIISPNMDDGLFRSTANCVLHTVGRYPFRVGVCRVLT